MVKVSVVVPVYNMEQKLERCLNSLVNQTLKDIELIIINDGSKDNSSNIIKRYKKKYKNIIFVDRENKGISYTRNQGIELAKGEYIAFVDSDDYVELDMFEEMYSSALKNNSDIVICNYNTFYENSNVKTKKNIGKNCKITNLKSNPELIYKIDYSPWNKIYKKDLWNDVKYPLNTKYEDLEAVLKVFLKADNVYYLNKYLYNYLLNDNGQTANINKKVFDIYIILDNLNNSFKCEDEKIYESFILLCIKKIFEYTHLILNKGDKELCFSFLDAGYSFLNNNFSNWKKISYKNVNGFKNYIMNFIRTIPMLYKLYLKTKFVNNSKEEKNEKKY